jgi:hypothetical protein
MEYKIIYTEAENMAMTSISYNVDDWIQNACHFRASQAIDAIVNRSINKFLNAGIQIPSSKDEIVLAAFENGWERTAEVIHEEFVANTDLFIRNK